MVMGFHEISIEFCTVYLPSSLVTIKGGTGNAPGGIVVAGIGFLAGRFGS